MFNSRMYKKYYPVKSSADIVNMDIADKKKLVKWIESIIADINAYNAQHCKHAESIRCKAYWFIDFHPDKEYVGSVCQKIIIEPWSMTTEDIKLVNFVLYRHKYVGIIPAYYFPTVATE